MHKVKGERLLKEEAAPLLLTERAPEPASEAAEAKATAEAPPAMPPPATDDPRIGTPWETKEKAMQSLNKRVQVWWDGNQCYFKGTIIAVSKTCRVKILYDDKQVRWEKLWEEDFSFIDHLPPRPCPPSPSWMRLRRPLRLPRMKTQMMTCRSLNGRHHWWCQNKRGRRRRRRTAR